MWPLRNKNNFTSQRVLLELDGAQSPQSRHWGPGSHCRLPPGYSGRDEQEAPQASAPSSRSQHLLGMEGRFTQGDRDGPGAAWHSRPPLSMEKLTLTLAACRLASAHLHFYSITISKNRDKKKKCRAPPLGSLSWKVWEGSAGCSPQVWKWGVAAGPPHRGKCTGSLHLSPLPCAPPQTLLIFPDVLEQGGFPMFPHQRKSDACSY